MVIIGNQAGSSRKAQFCSSKLLHILLALLVGLYTGINLSGIHHHNHSNVDESQSIKIEDELRKVQAEMKGWQEKANKVDTEYAGAINKVHELEGSLEGCTKNGDSEHHDARKLENPNSHPVCQEIPYPTPSAMALWNQNILKILEATRLPKDTRFSFHDFTAEALQIITPRLHRSVKSMPHEWASLERAMTIAWERYQFLQLSRANQAKVNNPPRPLKILVMGGSLLVGTNCRKLKTELDLNFGLPNRECNWSHRLLEFLNSYVGGELVQVTKVAMGGTNTATGSVIWKYDLIPEDAKNPDIVLNAYSTNDMHILTLLEARSANVTLRDKVFEMTQDYVRAILHTCDPSRPPPLLLHVDDYLGNEQRKIWDTTELSQGVQVLANYYGFTSFSYADVVRDMVYGDTRESWFSAHWWETGSFGREIHPGMGMHIASTWVAVYNMLNLVTTYCSIPSIAPTYNITEYETGVLGLPKLRKDVIHAQGKPKPHPKGLPPVLTKDLLIEDVTTLWRQAEQNAVICDHEKEGKHHMPKCPFSWVSGLSLQQNNNTYIQEYFHDQATTWDGWKLGNDGGKLGFVPTHQNASDMVLEFSYPQTIRSVTLFYMKSYGPKWNKSRLQIRSWKTPNESVLLDERYIVGFHDKNTSEMYTEAIELPEPIPSGARLKLGAKLVGGTEFKIMGLAVCS
jgi:hypothetical protein